MRKRIVYSKGEELPEGYVPESFFYLWKEDVLSAEDLSSEISTEIFAEEAMAQTLSVPEGTIKT